MKTITKILFLFSFFYFLNTQAQAPNKFSYQAVVRNTAGALVANSNVGIQISILQTTTTGPAVYRERHTTPTNANGLATIEIGSGTLVAGNFTTINWANGPFFIKIETDPTGGTSYSISGTSQMLSVPYAQFAAKSGGSDNSWGTNGNAATANDFIGTTNNTDLVFKRNGVQVGRIDNLGNIAIGSSAMSANTEGNFNIANGIFSLNQNTTGFGNTATGFFALSSNTIGGNNTAFGRGALSNVTTGSNNTGLGFIAQVASATGSNQVRIGNTAVTSVSAQVAFTTTSDQRWKSNIQKSNLGLEFIKQLNPVFYTRKDVTINDGKTTILETTSNPTTEYGFIAQELETTLNKFDASNNGIISKDDAGMYGVRYNDLIAPMVKAIQEQQAQIELLKAKIEKLENK